MIAKELKEQMLAKRYYDQRDAFGKEFDTILDDIQDRCDKMGVNLIILAQVSHQPCPDDPTKVSDNVILTSCCDARTVSPQMVEALSVFEDTTKLKKKMREAGMLYRLADLIENLEATAKEEVPNATH